MAAFWNSQDLETKKPPSRMTASQLLFRHQDAKTPPTVTSDSHLGHTQGASLDHLLTHLESSKQALEHQVQQLLQENRHSKSAKKEQQWQIEVQRLHSQLDSLNLAVMEKDERILQLERELRDAKSSMQQVQIRSREVEKEKERGDVERAHIQANLEDAQMKSRNLERELKLKHEVTEKQGRALESLADKMEKQKDFFQNQVEEVKRRLVEGEEREQKYVLAAQLASQKMSEKERQMKSLRDAHEKLVAAQKGKQLKERSEVEEVVRKLEFAQTNCEEQKAFIKEIEQELSKIKKEAHQLHSRVAVAEADANSKTLMLEKVQTELKNTASLAAPLAKSKAQVEDLKAQVGFLKVNLQEVEKTLSEESALRFKSECALNEYKVREKSLLKTEQDEKVLQEEIKWKNEQFQALEEAHNRMRGQFHEDRNMWASEKAAMLREIEVITENLLSRDTVIHDLRAQVKLLNQSLAHEENCRKLLEFQLADAKQGIESVSADFVAAQAILETLRENSKKELAFMKDTLTERDEQLKQLHEKQSQIYRDRVELSKLESELGLYKNRCDVLQETLEKRSEQEILAMETEVGRNAELISALQEEKEELLMRLNATETTLLSKDVEIKEIEMELDQARTLSEQLQASMSEAEEKHLEEKAEALRNLEEYAASLASKEQIANKLEREVITFQVVLNDVRECNADAERKIALLEESLRNAQRELHAKNSLNQSFLNVLEEENVVLAMRSECESLRRQLSEYDLAKLELEKHREMVSAESREVEKMYQRKEEELLMKLRHLNERCTQKDTNLNDLRDQIERLKQVVSTLEARCSTSEQQLSKQLLLAEKAREELVVEKLNSQLLRERAQILDASLAAEIAVKDASLKEIKETLRELTMLCKGGAQAAATQTLRISSIEENLRQQHILQGTMDGRFTSLLEEFNAVVGAVDRIAKGVAYLNTEFNSFEKCSKLNKAEYVTRLRAAESLFTSCVDLKEVTQQVGQTSAEKINFLSSLDTREDLDLLKKENESLGAERSRLEATVKDLEERLLKMVEEAESSKSIIDTLKAAQAASKNDDGKLHEVHNKLKESERKTMQLLSALEEARGFEHRLREAEAIVHDKEERLAASEWAVQQLAGEIAKSKNYLAQKEKDEIASRDRLAHLESEFRGKERELMELQCDLDNAVKASKEKATVVQELTCSKEKVEYILDLTKQALDEKTAAISALESEVRRLNETRNLTEEAFKACKEQLANEVKTNLDREQDMKRLCAEIDKANQEAKLAASHIEELQENLKCLERNSEARLESYERKMENGAADLKEYQDSCADLMNLVEKKDLIIQDLKLEVQEASKELAKRATHIEQGVLELSSVSQQLQLLKIEHATVDGVFKELEIQKRGLEEELKELKSLLSLATQDMNEKAVEIEKQKRVIERLEMLTSQQGDAHAVKSKELKVTVEERDNRLSKMQSLLTMAHDDLQAAYELVSTKEGEKRILHVKVSQLENQVEQSQNLVSQLQASLQLAKANLEAETERVWHQVAARNDIETELGQWKVKVTALEKSNKAMRAEFESSISKLQTEVMEWKEIAEHTENLSEMELDAWKRRVASLTESNRKLKVELENSTKKLQEEVKEWKEIAENTLSLNAVLEKALRAVQDSVEGCEKVVTSLAKEGDATNLLLESLLKQVHEEFRSMLADLRSSKNLVTASRREGDTLKAEIMSFIEVFKEQALLAVLTDKEGREQEDAVSKHLLAAILDFQKDLRICHAKPGLASDTTVSLQEAHLQLKLWKQRAEEWASFNDTLKQAFLDFEQSLLECKSDTAFIADLGLSIKSDIHDSFRDLRKEVEAAKFELLEMKDQVTAEAAETKLVQLELEACLKSLQAEVEFWKEKAATSAEESFQMKDQFEVLVKNLQDELKIWQQFGPSPQAEEQTVNAEVSEKRAAGVEGNQPGVYTANSINPFDREDEGCTLGWDPSDDADASTQCQGWNEKVTEAAEEGRKLTRQFRASFKRLHSQLESRKQAPKMTRSESFDLSHDDTGLESLVKALQEEAVEIKAELEDWKNKATSAARETASLKEDLEGTISKLKAEVEGWKDRSAMAAGQRIVARRQLEDFSNQVKSLSEEVQKWKDVATEANESSLKLQTSLETAHKENEDIKAEVNEWMQKALEVNISMKDLESDREMWKRTAISGSEQYRLERERMELSLQEMQTEVEKWRTIAEAAEEEGKSAKMELLDTLGKFEDELEVMSSNSIGEYSSGDGRTLKEEELDFSCHSSRRISFDFRHGPSEVEISLRDEIEDWKKRVASAEEQQESLSKQCEEKVKEVYLEVEAWKKSGACIAEDARLERAELERRLNEYQVMASDGIDERKSNSLEMAELQAELQKWKAMAAAAAEKCSSLRDAHDKATNELQLELAKFREETEAASDDWKSVKADLEKVVKDLQKEVLVWKEKAETALEGVAKTQEYEDLIAALDEEVCLWTQRTQEGKSLQLQLEKEQLQLKESLEMANNELQQWKGRALAMTKSIRSLQDDAMYVIDEEEADIDSLNKCQLDLQKWKTKARNGELLQLQLETLLAESQTQLQEWKKKSAAFSLASETLKHELDCIIEEGRLEKEELRSSIKGLEVGLCAWREKAQDYDSLQTQFKNSQTKLQEWDEKITAITQSTLFLLKEFELTIEVEKLDKKELCDVLSSLKTSVSALKEKATESESTKFEVQTTLVETQTELQVWKDRAAAVAIATKSMKEEFDSILGANRLQKEKLCKIINELEAELRELKSRAQKSAAVQLQLGRAQLEMEEIAVAATSDTQTLKDKLDSTILESSTEIYHLRDGTTTLEAELSNHKDDHCPLLPQMPTLLTESQPHIQEGQEKISVISYEESQLESNKSQEEKLRNFINALKEDLAGWQEKAKSLETLQLKLTSSLTTSQEELQIWKEEAMDIAVELQNCTSTTVRENCEREEKTQEGEFLHQQLRRSHTETQEEAHNLREKIVESTSFTNSLKDALESANDLVNALTVQLNAQKQKEMSLQKLNHQLEADIEQAHEENFFKKQKMTQILTQLEGTSSSQKELQDTLQSAHHWLLGNEKHRSATIIIKSEEKTAPRNRIS